MQSWTNGGDCRTRSFEESRRLAFWRTGTIPKRPEAPRDAPSGFGRRRLSFKKFLNRLRKRKHNRRRTRSKTPPRIHRASKAKTSSSFRTRESRSVRDEWHQIPNQFWCSWRSPKMAFNPQWARQGRAWWKPVSNSRGHSGRVHRPVYGEASHPASLTWDTYRSAGRNDYSGLICKTNCLNRSTARLFSGATLRTVIVGWPNMASTDTKWSDALL